MKYSLCGGFQILQKLSRRNSAGFSLGELLVSMLLGSILLAGVLSVFDGFKRSFAYDTSITGIQEQGRYAISYASERLRYRGYQGCLPPSVLDVSSLESTNLDLIYEVQPVANDFPNDTLPALSLKAHDISEGGDWLPPATDADLVRLKDGKLEVTPKEGTDVVMVKYASVLSTPLDSVMDSKTAPVTYAAGTIAFNSGDYAFVGDCMQADVFEVTNEPSTSDAVISLEHASSHNRTDSLARAYDTHASVRQFLSSTFFIADSGRANKVGDPVYSLFEMGVDQTVNEVIEGVENMQIVYGMINMNGQVTFVTADDASFDARRVISIQLGLLMRSRKPIKAKDDNAVYVLPGQLIGPGAEISHSGDKYFRQKFQVTVQFRNRG